MAQASYRRNVRTSFGARRPFYVKANGITQGSARDDAELAALIGRVSAGKPGVALVVVSFGKDGSRTERVVAAEATTLAA